jgi:flagellar biosynthesis chaperone FliJ
MHPAAKIETSRNRPRAFLAAVLCCVMLAISGCAAGLLYPRLDSVVAYYLEDLVTLDEAQSKQLKRTLSANLDWHRDSELRKYAQFLRGLSVSIEERMDRDAWLQASRQTEEYWRAIFSQAAPGYVAVAATLTDRQVAELMRNLEKEDEETWDEFAERTPEQRRSRREKSIAKTLQRFTGPLTPAQRAIVEEYSARARPFMAEWRENRRIWRDALAAALADRRSGESFDVRMTQLIARPDDLWTPQYRVAIDASRAALIDLLVDLDATLTATQRGAAQRELAALADEVQGLARVRG